MFRLARHALVALVLAAAGAAFASDAPDWWKSKVQLENKSSLSIFHLHLSPSDHASWGKDWLGTDILKPGETALITGLDCNTYDLKLIDEDGDACIVADVNLCLEDADWEITDAALVACQGWGN